MLKENYNLICLEVAVRWWWGQISCLTILFINVLYYLFWFHLYCIMLVA
jgi:hypothetical protein